MEAKPKKSSGAAPAKRPARAAKKMKKGEATRLKILKAARKVFIRYPYHAASIRMIGKAGRFDYTLIHHYFPNKADLFQAVVEGLYEEYMEAVDIWLDGLEDTRLREGFSTYVSRVVDYCVEKPDAFLVQMLNIAHLKNLDEVQGMMQFPRFFTDAARRFTDKFSLVAPEKEVVTWVYGQIMFLNHCLGAPDFQGAVLESPPASDEYRQWIKKSYFFLFYPAIKPLFFPGSAGL